MNPIVTVLSKETRLKGVLRFSETLRIFGNFEGEIDSTGILYIEDGAELTADVKARLVFVSGTVNGNIEAAERIEMLPGGKIYGNVRTAKLKISDGVVFEGKCDMIKNSDQIDIFSAPVSQLKKTMQSV